MWRTAADKHGGRSSEIIHKLITEVEVLKRDRLRKGTLPAANDNDLWPFDPSRGIPLKEVPDEVLNDWLNSVNRNGLVFDMTYAVVAERDLRLYDYVIKRLRRDNDGNPIPDPPPEPTNVVVI